MCEHCGSGPTCRVCGRGLPDMTLALDVAEVQLLQAALWEYMSARQLPTITDYVNKRYAGDAYGDRWRASKVISVTNNIQLALALRQKLFTHVSGDEKMSY